MCRFHFWKLFWVKVIFLVFFTLVVLKNRTPSLKNGTEKTFFILWYYYVSKSFAWSGRDGGIEPRMTCRLLIRLTASYSWFTRPLFFSCEPLSTYIYLFYLEIYFQQWDNILIKSSCIIKHEGNHFRYIPFYFVVCNY